MSLLPTLFAKPYFYRQRETDSQQEQKDLMQPTDHTPFQGRWSARRQKAEKTKCCPLLRKGCGWVGQLLGLSPTPASFPGSRAPNVPAEWLRQILQSCTRMDWTPHLPDATGHWVSCNTPAVQSPQGGRSGQSRRKWRWIGHQAAGTAHAHRRRPKLCLEAFGGTLATAITSQKCRSSPTWTHATRNYSETPEWLLLHRGAWECCRGRKLEAILKQNTIF